MQRYNNRSEVPDKYKWDLTDFFKDEKEFDKCFELTKSKIAKLGDFKGCTKDDKKLKHYLDLDIDIMTDLQNLYVYSYCLNDQELGLSSSIERKGKALNLFTEYESVSSFFAPELLSLSEKEYEDLVSSSLILEYKPALDRIYREKAHILTENEEMIISRLTSSVGDLENVAATLVNNEHDYGKITLEDGKREIITSTNLRRLLKSKDSKIRKKVYTSFNKKIDQYGATNASLLNSYVSLNNSIANIRKFKDSWSAKLFSLNLNDKVFKTLVKVTEANLDSLQRYYRLKKKCLGLDELHSYDLSLDIAHNDKEYTIEEAIDIIKSALKPLGKDYNLKLNKIFDNHYIDFCEYKGKRGGGYSIETIDHDSRILMSFNGDLMSISTIIHECGHNVNSQYIRESNPRMYRDLMPINAEVASLTNECLLSSYLAKNGETKEEKLAGIANILATIASNLYGAVREGKIEEEMYKEVFKGGSITKDFMDNLTKKSLKKYYGKEVKSDKYLTTSWITRLHYFMHFYLYSYAICISVAGAVASRIINGDNGMLSKYLEYLKCGSDKWPSEIFDVLGIDLEDENVYQEGINYFNSLIDEYEKILAGKE